MQELCPAQEIPQQVGGEPTISMTALLELLKDADPEMKAKLHRPCKNRAETVHPWLTKQKSHEIFRSTASTVDIPNHWDPQAKQQPTGLIACGAVRRRLVRAPSIVQTKRKTSTQRVLVFLGAARQSKSEPFPFDAA